MAAVIGFPYSGWTFFSEAFKWRFFRLWRWIRVDRYTNAYPESLNTVLCCCLVVALPCCADRYLGSMLLYLSFSWNPRYLIFSWWVLGGFFIFFSASKIDHWRRCIYFLLHPESGISIAQANSVEASLEDKVEKLRVKNGFCERDHCLVRKRCKTRSFLFCCLWVGEGGASCFAFFSSKFLYYFSDAISYFQTLPQNQPNAGEADSQPEPSGLSIFLMD